MKSVQARRITDQKVILSVDDDPVNQMVMENIENTPVKDKKKKKKEKEKDLGEMQVKLLLQWSLSPLINLIVDR